MKRQTIANSASESKTHQYRSLLMKYISNLHALALVALVVAPLSAGAGTGAFQSAIRYFSGQWHCSGHFANGKPISSSEVFRPILGGKWLLHVHRDDPPHHYDAYSIWGEDSTGNGATVAIHDSFGNLRRFDAHLADTKRILLQVPSGDSTTEAFVYLRKDRNHYQVTYKRKTGGRWVVGDILECHRSSATAL